ncbi:MULTISPECIES: hypothetical protein [Caproicibacterium]|uniref:Uncharacterized protein n=1 Tax=Caproicibacterium argilliputei TaxID=3030016 RepID=A0AA97H1X1_9FIRM|nr:hypothetical protein [Caproicibacterium argilliputei]WOC32863.1 hypothetical protein PXC00_03020 [Caproicibacterium argilliputei]
MDTPFWKKVGAFALFIVVIVLLCNVLSFVFRIAMLVVAVVLTVALVAYIVEHLKKKRNG